MDIKQEDKGSKNRPSSHNLHCGNSIEVEPDQRHAANFESDGLKMADMRENIMRLQSVGGSSKKRKKSDKNEASNEYIMASIDHLPEEQLLEVMSYLNLADRKNVRLVSKKWHRVSYDKKLIKNEWTNIGTHFFRYHTTPHCRHLNVKINLDANSLLKTLPFWEALGKEVEKIVFLHSITSDDNRALQSVLRCCPNVKHIKLTVTFSSRRDVTDIIFPVVPLHHLERLEFDGGSIRRGSEMLEALFADTPKLKELRCDDSYISGKKPLGLIERHSTSLEELGVRILSKNQLTTFINTVGEQLRRLYITFDCLSLTDSDLNAIARKFAGLEHLALCRVELSFSTHAIENLQCSLKNLTHLSLNDTTIPHSLLNAIDNWPQLVAIELNINDENHLKVAFRSSHPNLLNLRLRVENDVGHPLTLDVLQQICPNIPNLVALGLHNCHVKDEHLQVIARECTKLEELSLLRSYGFHCVAINGIKTLKHLLLHREYDSDIRPLLLPKLHTIHLTGPKVPPAHVKHVVEMNPSLHQVKGVLLNNKVQRILDSRTPSRPMKQHEGIFTWRQSLRTGKITETC